MLQRIGDALKGQAGSAKRKWITYLFVGALSIVFAAWGAYGIVNLSFGAPNYAAEAGGAKISLEQARNAWMREQGQWQQRLGGAELPASLRAQLQDGILEGMIRGTLLAQRTHELGYRVGREEFLAAVHSTAAFQINGQYSAEAARDVLARAGLTLEAFQTELREELQRSQLENGIRGSDFMTATEYQRLRELEDQEREVRWLTLPADKFPTPAPDDAAVKAYYDAHQAQFLTPESAHIQYAQLKLGTVESGIVISDADLRAEYDKQKDRLTVPEKRHARHILISGKDDAAALRQAQDVLAQAKAGKDFAALAQQYSKDPGSARNGGDLGWADSKSFVPAFSAALFSMQPGEIRGPVKTQFGYHIIRLDEIQAGKGKSFEESRAQLESDLRRNRATDRFGEIQEQLQAKLQEPGVDLGALAQEFQLQSGDIAQFLKGAGAAPFGAAPQLQELLFGETALAAGRVGGPVLIGNDALVVVKTLEHRKSAPRPLAEVRDEIVKAITKERASGAALEAARGAAKRLEAGTAFETVAQSLGITVEPARFVGRNDPSIPAPIRSAAFATPRPAPAPVYRALATGDGAAAVVGVLSVRTAAATPDAQAQADRERNQADRDGSGDIVAYVDEVRRTADVRKNPRAFD